VDINALIAAIKGFIEEVAPALAVMLWDYTEAKDEEAKNEARKAKTQLQEEINHETVDKENAGKSDSDILLSSIGCSGASGTGQPRLGDEGSSQTGTGTNGGSSDKKYRQFHDLFPLEVKKKKHASKKVKSTVLPKKKSSVKSASSISKP